MSRDNENIAIGFCLGIIAGLIIAGFIIPFCPYALAGDITPSPLEVTPNAYGQDLNRDQYGRPHVYQDSDGSPQPGVFSDTVKRDAYGLGVHADRFGKPVYDAQPEGGE
jgi:hypothetical protein